MMKFIKIAAGPFSVVFAWWFMASVVPQMDPSLKAAIDDGFFGMLFGIFGCAIIFVTCKESFEEIKSLCLRAKQPSKR